MLIHSPAQLVPPVKTPTQQYNRDGLCNDCAKNADSRFRSSRFHVPLKRLTTASLIPREWRSSCSLCRFLASCNPRVANEHMYALYAVSCLRFYVLGSSLASFAHPGIEDTNLWVFVPVDQWAPLDLPSNELVKNIIRDRGCVAVWDAQDEITSTPRYKARTLEPNSIDFDIVREWLSFCEQNHRSSCSLNVSDLPCPFAVIDCEHRTIVHLPQGDLYLCLSYVWGAPSTTSPLGPVKTGQGFALPEEVPLVVQDAIDLTRRVGFRYLWVDRYCISTEAAVKHEQIKDMHLVYQNAHATIIAAAGKDPSYGLPGISSRLRTPQPHVRIGTKIFASIMPHPGGAIRCSKWASRAWTYQECLLSRRRIFFTDEQVYFECHSMHCCEVFDAPLDELHTQDKSRFRISIREGLYPLNGLGEEPNDVWTRIEEYTQRSMTYDSDALNGMLGLLRAFSRLRSPVYHFWGVPFYKTGSTQRRAVDTFVKSLCWRLVRPSKRREGFPSWSWTGWKGAVCIRYVDTLFDRMFQAVDNLNIWVEHHDGTRDHWIDASGINLADKRARSLSRFLILEAAAIDISFMHLSTQGWTPKIRRHRSAELAHCKPAHICRERSSDANFLARLQNEGFTGLIIGDSLDHQKHEECLVLIVDERNADDQDAAERVGFCVIQKMHLRHIPRRTKQIRIG